MIEDYDKDGYLDVFVGGRHVPHNYPMAASSYILKNEKGIFKDITLESAPDLIDIGLVTDAVWTDFDNDSDLDLCVVGEWMQPTFIENLDNRFEKVNFEQMDSLSGWYFSIKALDVDNDGDDDYIVGNIGDNYKYKASSNEPFEVYYHDFDDNGKKDIVLSYYNFGELFPVRGKSCSTEQIPEIKKIIPTYDQFGKSTVEDIYGKENLKKALHLLSYNFKSGVIKNNGNGDFEFIAFPELAQVSSINDMLTTDIDGNGYEDIIIAGNLFVSEIETPRNDAGYGLVLLNNGEFKFEPINAYKSGLFLPLDCKNLNWLDINSGKYLLSGNNNNSVSVFSRKIIP